MNLLQPDGASILVALLFYLGVGASLVWVARRLVARVRGSATSAHPTSAHPARLEEIDARLSALETETAQLGDAQRFTETLLDRRRARADEG